MQLTSRFHFIKSKGFGPALDVVSKDQPVSVDKDGVDERPIYFSLKFRIIYVCEPVFIDPGDDLVFSELMHFRFKLSYGTYDTATVFFEFFEPCLCGRGHDTFFNGVHQICDAFFAV